MCNIINMADLLIIVISEAPIKQKIICIARSVARCARTSDGYTKADALIARAFFWKYLQIKISIFSVYTIAFFSNLDYNYL